MHDTSDDDEFTIDNTEITIDDFVLVVEFDHGNKKLFSIGRVLDFEDEECKVQYYRRLVPEYTFVDTKNTYWFLKTQIKTKLPPPQPSGSTERMAGRFVFPINLSAYNLFLK